MTFEQAYGLALIALVALTVAGIKLEAYLKARKSRPYSVTYTRQLFGITYYRRRY